MSSFLSIIPLAAVDSINVLALLAVSYVWVSSPSRWEYVRTSAAFVVGGVCGLTMALAFSFTVLVGLVLRVIDSFPPTAVAVVVLLIALGVLAMAVHGFLHSPTSLPVHSRVHPVGAYVLGLITWAAQSLTSAPFYGAIAVMADHGTAMRLALSAVFVVIALVPVTSLLIALAMCPAESGRRLLAGVQRALPIAAKVVSVILIIAAVTASAIAIDEII